MSEFSEEQKASLEFKFYDKNLILLGEINKKLNSIKNWVTLFGVVWIIVQILSLITALMG